MLGWYIPGLSELLLLLLAGPFQRFFVFSISLGTFGYFSLFSCCVSSACVCSEHGTADEPGAVAGVGGCWRVEGGVARSAVAVFVARRRVCLETRGKHEWALSGLHLHNSIECVRVYKGLSRLQGNIQAVLIFANGLKITEGATQSEQQYCEAGERRPR